jgi:DNA-directed RNA polymerase specialized sigma24 family protein
MADTAALSAHYERHYSEYVAFVQSRGTSRQDAEDIVQSLFVDAFARPHRLPPVMKPGFFNHALRCDVIDHQVKNQRRQRILRQNQSLFVQ